MNIGKQINRAKIMWQLATSTLPVGVAIETQSLCNLRCPYCPHAYTKRAKSFMRTDTIRNIVTELAANGYEGYIYPYGFDEPLLDDRIVDIVAMIRGILPKSHIWLSSNGILLTQQIEDALSKAGATTLYITRHGKPDTPETKRMNGSMVVRDGPRFDIFNNRMGLVPITEGKWKRHGPCVAAYTLYITVEGDIAWCCNDYNATRGTRLTVFDREWLRKWQSIPRRIKRLRSVVGPRPKGCFGCMQEDR